MSCVYSSRCPSWPSVLAAAAAPPLPAAARGNTGGWYPCHAPHPAQPTANLAQKKSQSALTGSCGEAFGLAVVVTGVLATTGMREALAGSITVAGTVTTLGALGDNTNQGSQIRLGFELEDR